MAFEMERYKDRRHTTPDNQGKFITEYEFEGPEIQALNQQNPDVIYTEVLNLGTAQPPTNPKIINVPGRGVNVYGMQTAYVYDPVANTGLEISENNIFIHCRVNFDRLQNAVSLKHNRGFWGPFNQLFLSWPQQSNVSARLYIYKNGTAPWQATSEGNENIGSSILTTNANVTVGAAATLILPVDYNREVATLSNFSANNISLGDVNITLGAGTLFLPNANITYRNSAALYGIASGNSTVGVNVES